MSIYIKSIFVIVFLAQSLIATSQDENVHESKRHHLILKTQYLQLDDQINYGYVFDGINIMIGYGFLKETGKVLIQYEGDVGFGVVNNRGHGFYWKFKPLDFFHGFKVKDSALILGAYLGAEYSWQQYDELHGGRLFWLSNIEIGPEVHFSIPIAGRKLNFRISSSVAGFSGRPEYNIEQYYYSFDFQEFISSSHRNSKFGSLNLFNHSKITADIISNKESRIGLEYEFDYLGYYDEPKATFLTHSLNLKWRI